jgi:hypothetical protein
MPTITICSSASFYEKTAEIQRSLEKAGYKVIIPAVARKMQQTGDFEVTHYKTWFGNDDDYDKKASLMHGHFNEVVKGDAILVLNYEKKGVKNYIGGNVLMEMGLAFHFNKPIFILNEIPEESVFLEEIKGFLPTVLHGNIENFNKVYKA